MDEHATGMATGTILGRLAGAWQGTNGFRMMPTDDMLEAPATAVVTIAAGGYDVVVTYTWNHPQDGPQEGVLLIGSPDEERQAINAAWGDSWHQKPSLLVLSGRLAEGRVELIADYGGGWQWTIGLEGDNPLVLTMHNVIPEEHATEEIEAGPYPVMITELHREP
jgi:hypothetical protein